MSTFTIPEHRRKSEKRSRNDSSEPSMSEDSAMIPTTNTDASTNASDYDSDMESEISSSSEEPSDMSSSEDESDAEEPAREVEMQDAGPENIVNLRANRGEKPVMKFDAEEMGPDIRTFLKDFLPQLKAANEELETQKKAGQLKSFDLEETEEGKPYIEMDLGLGVLEAKNPNAIPSETNDSDNDDPNKERDILGKLMGREAPQETASIEIVQDKSGS